MMMLFSWHSFLGFLGGAVFIGGGIWYFLRLKIQEGEEKAVDKIKFAKTEALLEAREAQLKFSQELDKEKLAIQNKYANMGTELARRESDLRDALRDFQTGKDVLEDRKLEIERLESEMNRKRNNVENLRQLYRKRLVQIAHINETQAKELLKEELAQECKEEVKKIRQEILSGSLEEAEIEAKRVLVDTMQRLSNVPSSNMSAALIKLPNEDIKGRLIGKEGRNIKSFESETGTTLLIDETPGTVLVSSFDPVRREIARIALESLIQDGRIHPASIEETVKKSKLRIDKEIFLHGEKAVARLNLKGLGQEIIGLLGKLYYRLSNNQNTLEHSIEVAYLCAMMASELGLDPQIAKRCGLLHDIGKAIECDNEGSHANVAAQLLKRNGEDSKVVNAVEASHQEVPSESIYSELLKLADKLSATRPGARADSMDGFIQRKKSLEGIAQSFEGIEDVYAIQAGREIRVVVSPEVYEENEAQALASQIRHRIEEELSYPGKIKVVVIREQRFVDTAQ